MNSAGLRKNLSSCVFVARAPRVVLLFDRAPRVVLLFVRDFELCYCSSEILSCATFRQRFWAVHFLSEISICAIVCVKLGEQCVLFFVRGVDIRFFIELCFKTWITLYSSKKVWKNIILNLDFLHPEVPKCNMFSHLIGVVFKCPSEFQNWWELIPETHRTFRKWLPSSPKFRRVFEIDSDEVQKPEVFLDLLRNLVPQGIKYSQPCRRDSLNTYYWTIFCHYIFFYCSKAFYAWKQQITLNLY